MAHVILDNCILCDICPSKCPTEAIAGASNAIYHIDPSRCIDCGACGIHCPVGAIVDSRGEVVKKIEPVPKAKVDPVTCSACEFCVDICPVECISMQPRTSPPEFYWVAVVDEDKCTSCKLCETVCMKESITVGRTAELMSYLPYR